MNRRPPLSTRDWPVFPTGATKKALSLALRETTEATFDSLGAPLVYTGELDPNETIWQDPLAILAFTGPDVAGSLVLSVEWPLVGKTCPTGTEDTESLVDWSRELTNLLLGSMKAWAVARGISFQAGIPTSIVSSAMKIASIGGGAFGHRFVHSDLGVATVLDIRFAQGVELGVGEVPETTGEVLFF